MVVERRGDALVLEFVKPDGSIFAQSVVDCSCATGGIGAGGSGSSIPPTTAAAAAAFPPPVVQQQQQRRMVQHWLEGTVDSSRYFTLKIVAPDGAREAIIGFGFRDRDQATDLREAMQHYENAMHREALSSALAAMATTTLVEGAPEYKSIIPKLAEGEKIHIYTGKKESGTGSHSSIIKPKKKDAASTNTTGSVPRLLKKPPSSPESEAKQVVNDAALLLQQTQQLENAVAATSLEEVAGAGDNEDDDDWDTEFVSAN